MKIIACYALIILTILLAARTNKFVHATTSEDKYTRQRLEMVEGQIAARGVKDPKVLDAMRNIPRHLFVPEEYKNYGYEDQPVPIGCGQTISQPYIVALMTELLEVDGNSVALEIGTGSGYQAAVLSKIVKQVYTIEIIEELGIKAKKRLEEMKYSNVAVKVGDGYFGLPEHAPFDAIIVTAAANHIPPPLIQQLKPGGRMAIPIGTVYQVQNLMLVMKDKDEKIIVKNVLPVRFVPLLGKH
ncbi:MAG TPA: protein-L-isoaspartate(D-aspartate) O-methyltransferase [Candidatus Brocadiia bacterium]|nr:protein-L-isoaspartate(D-aspartate) O-methyltransferase [Planctomycetota bacterium]MDO8093394.1 protein-L-isoaspartate(D-aspartate) O-methyltransferase [Candidatus Brocadiales bacterium]